jgi:hypothetical protein
VCAWPAPAADLGHKLLNNPVIWIGMEREWEIGTQVRPWQLAGSAVLSRCITAGSLAALEIHELLA